MGDGWNSLCRLWVGVPMSFLELVEGTPETKEFGHLVGKALAELTYDEEYADPHGYPKGEIKKRANYKKLAQKYGQKVADAVKDIVVGRFWDWASERYNRSFDTGEQDYEYDESRGETTVKTFRRIVEGRLSRLVEEDPRLCRVCGEPFGYHLHSPVEQCFWCPECSEAEGTVKQINGDIKCPKCGYEGAPTKCRGPQDHHVFAPPY